ncbi:MAG: hypothetical protein ETSY2_42220 [Candidatus Entotheonella gemina]|uniref:HTH lysR-type domain-containing protein n=1 Tax=Candidatus Entotheonella gemina TaxID=1429439 RepID=W4LL38_9BACT|nr:MAG: hypothetical protein ETSY2_42220 [Candidatus Entotheonella gemina]
MKGGIVQLTHLHYFRVIAQCGNLTHAARQLGVQQSTLSVAVQRLEAEMGTTLLLRDRSGVTLTSTGRSLLPYVTEALALLDAGAEHVQGLETEDVGSFVLGVPMALGSYFLPGFLLAFQRQAPRIELSLWTGTSLATVQAAPGPGHPFRTGDQSPTAPRAGVYRTLPRRIRFLRSRATTGR